MTAIAKRMSLGPVREKLLHFLADNPGATIQRVAAVLGTSHSTATFYLNTLVRKRLVIRQRDGRTIQHYLTGRQTPKSLLHPFIQDERSHRVCRQLVQLQGRTMTLNQFARQLELNYGFVLRTMKRLTAMGFVHFSQPRSRYLVQPTDRLLQIAKQLGWAEANATVTMTEAPQAEFEQ